MREMIFCCGIEGSEAEHATTFEQEVLACIEGVAAAGIDGGPELLKTINDALAAYRAQ